MSTFHCKSCGRAIFRSENIIEQVNLWDLQDYQAQCYAVKEIIDLKSLTRYDVSLHEGWYCCRFIAMRMTENKFGTDDKLLVYADSVQEVQAGQKPATRHDHKGQIKLTAHDYDAMLHSVSHKDKLLVVKYGAIWCPPCRLMDNVFAKLNREQALPDVVFFEVDTDEEPILAARWHNQSIPFSVFYYNARQIELHGQNVPTVDGGLIGGLGVEHIKAICNGLLEYARAGHYEVSI